MAFRWRAAPLSMSGTGEVLVDYIGTSPASNVAASLKSAYASGAWTGSGITSSATSHPGTGVGYDDTGSQVEIKIYLDRRSDP